MNAYVSPSDLVQADRILRIETPLGAEAVLAERFEMTEGIGGFGAAEGSAESGLFAGWIAVRSPRHDIAAAELVGRMVDVSVEVSAGSEGGDPAVRRTWHCLVSELLVGPPVTRGLRSYRLRLRPAHWLLTRRRDCRIWRDHSALDVARTLMSEHGLTAPVTTGVATPPPPQHHSVQFNESDWAYLVRRLEQDGLFHWTRHEGGAAGAVAATCDLHIASDVSGYTRADERDGWGDGRVRYAAGSSDRNQITRFDTAFAFVPGSRAGADWNFLTPGTVPSEAVPSHVRLPGGALGSNHDYESYEYPSVGGYGTGAGANGASEGIDRAELDRLERLRAQAHEADHARVEGEGTVRTLAPGQRFTPYDVAAEAFGGVIGSAASGAVAFDEHVVLSVTHRATDQSYETQGGDPEYGCTFTALPATTPATPHRRCPRPRIDGQQIAIVAGPGGEEIHTDEFGRVKLWFPWDRRAAKDGTDTCWVRVAQSWAGTGWGAQVIPRIGMEAVVSYLDGDPDRPLVTGLVPNPTQAVPYDLPANKTRTVMRSNSHKAGGFNEISFEDKTGQENLFFHAQKDQTTRVLNNRTERVEAHHVESVGGNRNVHVASNLQEKIGANMNLSVGGGGSGVMGALAKIVSAGGTFLKKNGASIGHESLDKFAGTVAAAEAAAELLVDQANAEVMRAGGHRKGQGTDHADKGGRVGALLSRVMPGQGILDVVVERFRSDTVGVARTEQIGFQKNTVVGHTQSVSVGKLKKELIGETYDLEAKKSIFSRTTTHTIMGKDKVVIGGPGGTIVIDERGVTIKAKHIWLKSPQIDMLSGSPDAVTLSSDKPFAENCGKKGG